MKIKKGMILAAGLGTRMQEITKNLPKPLIKIGKYNLLERSIGLLENHGVNNLVINTHYLKEDIKKFIKDKNYNIQILISEEEELLDTGGGILKATQSFDDDPFIAINPDTIWSINYENELKSLEQLYFKCKNPSILLVDKLQSFDTSFKGDFSISNNNLIERREFNQFIFTGLQILNKSAFNNTKNKIFSMNQVWDELIASKKLYGIKSEQKFIHLNTKDTYEKIKELKIID